MNATKERQNKTLRVWKADLEKHEHLFFLVFRDHCCMSCFPRRRKYWRITYRIYQTFHPFKSVLSFFLIKRPFSMIPKVNYYDSILFLLLVKVSSLQRTRREDSRKILNRRRRQAFKLLMWPIIERIFESQYSVINFWGPTAGINDY